MRRLILAAIAATTFAGVPAIAEAAPQPAGTSQDVQVTPSAGPAGSTVLLSGTGWPAGDVIEVEPCVGTGPSNCTLLSDQGVSTAADSGGGFSNAQDTVPSTVSPSDYVEFYFQDIEPGQDAVSFDFPYTVTQSTCSGYCGPPPGCTPPYCGGGGDSGGRGHGCHPPYCGHRPHPTCTARHCGTSGSSNNNGGNNPNCTNKCSTTIVCNGTSCNQCSRGSCNQKNTVCTGSSCSNNKGNTNCGRNSCNTGGNNGNTTNPVGNKGSGQSGTTRPTCGSHCPTSGSTGSNGGTVQNRKTTGSSGQSGTTRPTCGSHCPTGGNTGGNSGTVQNGKSSGNPGGACSRGSCNGSGGGNGPCRPNSTRCP